MLALLTGMFCPQLLSAACNFAVATAVQVYGSNDCVTFMLQLAHTPAQQRCGLSGRDYIQHDHGMLFDFRGRRAVSMWMKDTRVPLDLLFVNNAGEIIGVYADAEPYSEEHIQAPAGTVAVLELVAGVAADSGVGRGSLIIHSLFGNQADNICNLDRDTRSNTRE